MLRRSGAAILLAQCAAAAVIADVHSDKKDVGVALALPAQFDSAVAADAAAGAPNLVVFLVDDLGYGDVAFMQTDVAAAAAMDTASATPALAAMAAKGVRLTAFYTSPTCTPSRASLMTGKYTTNMGLQDSVIHATEPRGLSLDHALLSERLRGAGYRTLGVGKWHLGFHQPQYLPSSRGFDEYFGVLTGGGGHFSHQTSGEFTLRGPYQDATVNVVGSNLWHNGHPVTNDDAAVHNKHTTALYTEVALAQLSASYATDVAAAAAADVTATATPFFLYLAFQAVHAPMEVPAEFTDGSVPNGCAFIADDAGAAGGAASGSRRALCGMLSQLDVAAAALEAHLRSDAMGNAWANTVLVFASDNGGVAAHGSSNAPYKGGKGTYYEGGVRVPCFFSGGFTERALKAANTPLGQATNALVHVTDVHATFLGLAAVPFATSPAPSGSSSSSRGAARRRRRLDAAPDADADADAAAVSIDGVDQWAFLVGGAEHSASAAAFAPRTSVLHNLNSDAFGSGGALRLGDFKLLATPKVSEAEVYAYAQHVLQDGDFAAADVASVLGAKLLQKTAPAFSLFNVRKNPTERADVAAAWQADGACVAGGGAEACADLFDDPDYALVQAALLDAWAAYRDAASPSEALTFADDGPLADPALFGGYWAAWRDEQGAPYATYATSDRFASSSGQLAAGSEWAAETAAAGTAGTAETASGRSSGDGTGDGTGGNTWKASKDLAAGSNVVGAGNQAQHPRLAAAVGQMHDARGGRSSSSSSQRPHANAPESVLVSVGVALGAVAAVALQAAWARLGAHTSAAGRGEADGQRYATVCTEEA